MCVIVHVWAALKTHIFRELIGLGWCLARLAAALLIFCSIGWVTQYKPLPAA
jgi:hypothetical protein